MRVSIDYGRGDLEITLPDEADVEIAESPRATPSASRIARSPRRSRARPVPRRSSSSPAGSATPWW
jgi:hypothetical protein